MPGQSPDKGPPDKPDGAGQDRGLIDPCPVCPAPTPGQAGHLSGLSGLSGLLFAYRSRRREKVVRA
jgi:hypothetical protein